MSFLSYWNLVVNMFRKKFPKMLFSRRKAEKIPGF